MKKIIWFVSLLFCVTFLLGTLVSQSISDSRGLLSPNDESYRERLVTINSRPLGDGLLGGAENIFPFDNAYIKKDDTAEGKGEYTSPTNIGLYLTYLLGIYQGQIKPFYDFSKEKALERIELILQKLDNLPEEDKWQGLYFWMVYENGKWVRAADGRGNYVISQPDNGNLFAAFITVLGGAEIALTNTPRKEDMGRLENIKVLAQKLILEADWTGLMDPERGLYYLAYIPDTGQPLRFGGDHVGGRQGAPIYVENLMDEWRLGVLVAYLLSDLPNGNTQGLDYTTWTQLDREKRAFKAGDGKVIEALASGHGGMFQQRLPLIFVPERKWSKAFKDNHDNFFYIATNFAQSFNQPFLLSAATNPEGFVEYIALDGNPDYAVDTTYDEFGTKPLALKQDEEFTVIAHDGDRVVGDVTTLYYASTPHALALGFLTNPEEVIALFKKAELRLKVFTFPGGVPDAYGVKDGRPHMISYRTLILDQLMFVLALQGEAFYDDFEAGLKVLGVHEKAKELYANEEKYYPGTYPLRREGTPEINTDIDVYLGSNPRNYPTAIKLVRQLAIESGFKILSETSEQLLAAEFSEGKIDRGNLKSFFKGNLLGVSAGEHGTYKPRWTEGDSLKILAEQGWFGDRLPLIDFREADAMFLEVEPPAKDTVLVLELKGRDGKSLFQDEKLKVVIPKGESGVLIDLPELQSPYLSYLVVADATSDLDLKSLRLVREE